jgi:H+/Cl- antiporter ClcA
MQEPLYQSALKWLIIALLIGSTVGSCAAFFLFTLDWVTNYRVAHNWLIAFLPLGGLLIGWIYHRWGSQVVKGNNLLIENYHQPENSIPFRMAPMVYVGTIITHLFGGSAGREGTAIQMGGAIADRFTQLFKLTPLERRPIIIMGISAGFAGVFGTPIAAAIFALEMLILHPKKYVLLIPGLLASFVAHITCNLWNVSHTQYEVNVVPDITISLIGWCVLVGILFGLAAWLFIKLTKFWSKIFHQLISFPPLRPTMGGVIIAIAVWLLGTDKYLGLGIPTIVSAFSVPMLNEDFLLKILFTSFTIGAGFKGGEVTPLFFIGATLGNILVWFVPLPMALLAAMGFVAVFAGASHTPITSAIMGMELFGVTGGVYIAIACACAYMFSGNKSIYESQPSYGLKQLLFKKVKSYFV